MYKLNTDLSNRTTVYNTDCNSKLLELCETINWKSCRAILFLDPYATELKWETLKRIASTKAIDVWYLFPFSAAFRLMKKDGEIEPSWKAKLDMIFGDSGWYKEFYERDRQMSMFDDNERFIKTVNTESLKKYICRRLETIFPKVAQNPRILYNSKSSPLFLFCFAISNDSPKAIGAALRGADHILKFTRREIG